MSVQDLKSCQAFLLSCSGLAQASLELCSFESYKAETE